ncbi:hypothetical protein N0V90_004088 [Kalmusia sp. IMI 367209]|nr:hypothetical protein N0V90_004088 [Kalmusia sp. IMI 367209]
MPTPARRPAVDDELPPYKKPAHPLNQRAQDQLRTLNGRSIVHLKEHSQKAGIRITDTVGLVQDILKEREDFIERARKNWEKGIDTEEQEQEEARFAELQQKVEESTKRLEESMRAVIDSGIAAQRLEDSLDWLRQNAPGRLEQEFATQRSRRESQRASQSQQHRTQDEEEEEEHEVSQGPTPGPTPLDGSRPALTGASEMFADRMQRQKDEYTSISLGGRYSRNNAYIGFKRMLHDARYRDEERPLPDPNTWFTATGSPAPGITGHGEDNDDDDDIVMDRATVSIRCPLTFQQFKEPYTSVKCPHTFERNAILEMIRKSNVRVGGVPRGGEKAVGCPVAGCSQMLTANDLQHDPILVRKIKRMQQAEARAAEESEAEDEREVYVSQLSRRSTRPRIKVSPSSRLQVLASQEPPRSLIVDDIASPSEEDDDG